MESPGLRQFSRRTPGVVDKSTEDGRGRGCRENKPMDGGDNASGGGSRTVEKGERGPTGERQWKNN